jgi:magnesium transporter
MNAKRAADSGRESPAISDGDRPMLVNSVAYQNGRRIADIATSDIQAYLKKPGCFVWVALVDPDPEVLDHMRHQFGLHPLAVEDACHGHQRPKIEEYGDCVFVVMQMIESDGEALRVGEVAIFAGSNYILSVRRGAERGFRDVRERAEREPDLLRHGSCYVLYALMDAVVDRYFPVLDLLEQEFESIEERIFAADSSPRTNMEALYSLKQRLMIVKHAIVPMLEAVSNLSGARVPVMLAGIREYFRDIYDHLKRLNETIESTRDTLATAISVNISMISMQESETMKRLAGYAALIAVPTLIAGIYGMNFEHMPELKWRYGYALVMGLMVVIDGYLFYRFRGAKWV